MLKGTFLIKYHKLFTYVAPIIANISLLFKIFASKTAKKCQITIQSNFWNPQVHRTIVIWHFFNCFMLYRMVAKFPNKYFSFLSYSNCTYCPFGVNYFFHFHFLCLIRHVIKRYGWEISTVQGWASNSQYWWSYGTLNF